MKENAVRLIKKVVGKGTPVLAVTGAVLTAISLYLIKVKKYQTVKGTIYYEKVDVYRHEGAKRKKRKAWKITDIDAKGTK